MQKRETLVRINAMLSVEVLDWLDRDCFRLEPGADPPLSRSELLRGIVGFFARHRFYFAGCTSTEDVVEAMAAYLRDLAAGTYRAHYTSTLGAERGKQPPPRPV